MVTGTVLRAFFLLLSFCFFVFVVFAPLLAREEGRVGLFILGSPPQQQFVYTGPATQLCTTACSGPLPLAGGGLAGAVAPLPCRHTLVHSRSVLERCLA